MLSISEINRKLNEYIDSLDLSAEPSGLYIPIKYSLEGGGKRLRPMLTLLSCGIFSDDPLCALPAAAAVEVFHNFTLLHDDVMDNAATRRGKASVFSRFGLNSAILSGDAMMIYAYRLLNQVPSQYLPSVLNCFNYMAMAVCEGQQLDMEFESKDEVGMDEYLDMIDRKTGALLTGAVMIGAIMGGADKASCARLMTFSKEFGQAFQIQDDLLDAYGTERQLGKRIGGDIVECKKTFLSIAAEQKADRQTRAEIQHLLSRRDMERGEKISRMMEHYDALRVGQFAAEEIGRRFDTAAAALDSIDVPSERLSPIKELAMSLLNRDR